MSEFVYEVGPWIKREQVAREAGVELDELSLALSNLVCSNYFGVGCEEGDALYASLRRLIEAGTAELHANASLVAGLANNVSSGSMSIQHAEDTNTHSFAK